MQNATTFRPVPRTLPSMAKLLFCTGPALDLLGTRDPFGHHPHDVAVDVICGLGTQGCTLTLPAADRQLRQRKG